MINVDKLSLAELAEFDELPDRLAFPNAKFEIALRTRFSLEDQPDISAVLRDIARGHFYMADYVPRFVWYDISDGDWHLAIDFVEEQRRVSGFATE